jgi:hypothetical protein
MKRAIFGETPLNCLYATQSCGAVAACTPMRANPPPRSCVVCLVPKTRLPGSSSNYWFAISSQTWFRENQTAGFSPAGTYAVARLIVPSARMGRAATRTCTDITTRHIVCQPSLVPDLPVRLLWPLVGSDAVRQPRNVVVRRRVSQVPVDRQSDLIGEGFALLGAVLPEAVAQGIRQVYGYRRRPRRATPSHHFFPRPFAGLRNSSTPKPRASARATTVGHVGVLPSSVENPARSRLGCWCGCLCA